MQPAFFIKHGLEPALGLLPASMDSPAARAMVLAICFQESRLLYRKQINGPAKGYAQFEQGGGVKGVLTHPATVGHARVVCAALDYIPEASAVYTGIEHNDILAAAFARLLLYSLPEPLPEKGDPDEGWKQYISAWRPGKPHRATWNAFYVEGWALV